MACPRGTPGCNGNNCTKARCACYGPHAPRYVDVEDDLSRQRALTVFLLIVGVFSLWVGLVALVVAVAS